MSRTAPSTKASCIGTGAGRHTLSLPLCPADTSKAKSTGRTQNATNHDLHTMYSLGATGHTQPRKAAHLITETNLIHLAVAALTEVQKTAFVSYF